MFSFVPRLVSRGAPASSQSHHDVLTCMLQTDCCEANKKHGFALDTQLQVSDSIDALVIT